MNGLIKADFKRVIADKLLLVIAIMWIVGKIVPKLAVTRKKRRRIAYIPNIVMYILLILVVWGEKYVVTGIKDVEKEYEISLPSNFAYYIDYPQFETGGDDYREIKYLIFLGKISDETLARLDELCEQYKQGEQKEYFQSGWEKNGDIYHYWNKDGGLCYDLTIDIATNTAVSDTLAL